jgi:hypothetical protein
VDGCDESEGHTVKQRTLTMTGLVTLWATLAWAQGGTISGMVSTKVGAPRPLRVTIDQEFCGAEVTDESIIVGVSGGLANAVVSLRGLKSRQTPPDGLVTNSKCRFTPRVQIVRPAATIRTVSDDPLLHTTNVQDQTGRTLFNLAIPVPGLTLSRAIGGPGIYRVGCNIHPWMRAWLFVTEDVASITGPDGRFVLADVPPGTYELTLWHEALKAVPQKVTVVAGKPTRVMLEMK